jgi:hypothetical protein
VLDHKMKSGTAAAHIDKRRSPNTLAACMYIVFRYSI